MIDQIHWLGHAGFRIEGPPHIVINPWRVARSALRADVILISNDAYDHCSPADVEKLRGPNTLLIGSPGVATVLGPEVKVLRAWQSINVGAARITAVPAYTFTPHHPASKGELGFVISLGFYDIYYAGCTDLVPEMDRLRADVAILPLAAGPGTLTVERHAEVARKLGASWVVPSHWGTLGGTAYEVQALSRALQGTAQVAQAALVR